jgi:NAD(P)-dependent dehydrogenase (short-subunit alcohol dehydrogenase family)
MKIEGKVALVTGAASGIGEAVASELARRGVKAVACVDRGENVTLIARNINTSVGRPVAEAMIGDVTSAEFRARVFNQVRSRHGIVNICVPAAGITRDGLSVKVDKETGKALVYAQEQFEEVTRVNLIAPVYWALQTVAGIAEERRRLGLGRWEPPEEKLWGTVVFIGSVSSLGNKGQISYAASKAGLEGAAATLMKEAIYHGVRCCVIHPGFTDTPMVRALGQEYIEKNILPYTQLRRLIRPDEIADAICFLIANSAVSGELWADAGWHPSA